MNVDAIPLLPQPYKVKGAAELAIIGDAPKDYIVLPGKDDHAHAYIAKKPRREGPIECVTEYLIARIGRELPVAVAEGRLVRLLTKPGQPADVRFMSRQFLRIHEGEHLVHGSQLVARCFQVEEGEIFREVERGKEWQFYTVELVDEVLGKTANSDDEHARLRAGLARLLAFDALIGANDRHAQNWGVIENAIRRAPVRMSPIFDTARGLFWNSDERRLADMENRGRQGAIEQYANRSTPLIGVGGTTRQPNHFDVMAYVVRRSEYRDAAKQIIRAFSVDAVARILHVEFRHLLSRRRLEFIIELLRYRRATLARVCGLS